MRITDEGVNDLVKLNQVVSTLNRSVDVRSLLDEALLRIVDLLSLETAWIVLIQSPEMEPSSHTRYTLAAYVNLPPALAPHKTEVWGKLCDCQNLCNQDQLLGAVNLLHCSRLASAGGNRHGLTVHASSPLRSGDLNLGILNVAAPDDKSFTPRTLALLSSIGVQMGIALERARLYDLLRQRHILEQTALLDLSNQLLAHSNLDDVLNLVVREVPRLLNADACAVLLPAIDNSALTFHAAYGWHADPTGQRVSALPTGPGAFLVSQAQSFSLDQEVPQVHAALLPFDLLQAEAFNTHMVASLASNGSPAGLLYLDYRSQKTMLEEETRFLNLLSNQAAIAIEQARLREDEKLQQRTQNELEIGRRIQVSLLPQTPPNLPGWQFALSYRAAHQLSGDFYDFIQHPNRLESLGMVIADVADKGVPASILMAVSRTVMRAAALTRPNPAEALKRANSLLRRDNRVSFYLSAFYALLDVNTGRLTFANAGHNLPLWLRSGRDACEQLQASGAILGVFDEFIVEEKVVMIEEGDFLVFYTDGFSEAFSPDNQEFGWEGLKSICMEHRHTSAQELLDQILLAVDQFTGATELSDDQTIFVVRREVMGPASGI